MPLGVARRLATVLGLCAWLLVETAAAAPPGPDSPPPTAAPPAEPDPTSAGEPASGAPPPVAAVFSPRVAGRLDPYGPRPPGVPRLSRDQIVRYSLENPIVAAATADVEAMEALLLQARFAWVPVVKATAMLSPGANIECDDVKLARDPSDPAFADEPSFDFEYCRPGTKDDLDINTIGGYFQQIGRAGIALTVDATMLVPLTTFGKIWHTREAAEVGVALTKLQRERERQEVVLKVQEAHAALLLARASIGLLDEAWQVVEDERRKIVRDLGGDGFELDPDAVNPDRDPDDLVELEVGEIEVATLMREARKVEALSLAALWALAGQAAPPGFDVAETELLPDEISGGLRSVAHYRELAARNRPEARMAQAGVELRRRQEKLARANFLPDLGIAVALRYGYGNAAPQSIPSLYYSRRLNYSNITAALALSWNLDFHNDAFALKAARAQRRKAESQREVALALLGLDVERAYRDLVGAQGDAELMALARDRAWRLVVSQQQKQSVGGGAFRDLRRHLKSWAEFQFKHFSAIQAQNVALARLARAVGTPLSSPPLAASGPR